MTVKCPICGRPYKIWASNSGDQSACPRCQREAERANSEDRPDTWEEWKRRQDFFYGKGNPAYHNYYFYKKSSTTDIRNEPNFHPDWGSFS